MGVSDIVMVDKYDYKVEECTGLIEVYLEFRPSATSKYNRDRQFKFMIFITLF